MFYSPPTPTINVRDEMDDAIKMMESKMSAESVARSRMIAEQEILAIRLSKLGEKLNNEKDEFEGVNQTTILQHEKRIAAMS